MKSSVYEKKKELTIALKKGMRSQVRGVQEATIRNLIPWDKGRGSEGCKLGSKGRSAIESSSDKTEGRSEENG